MSWPRSLSLRYKLPLAFAAVIIVTALVVTGVLSWYTYRQMRDDLFANAEGISKTLARGLAPLMLRDEVWQAFETIATPLNVTGNEEHPHRLVVVLDGANRVFVSTQPRHYPLERELIQVEDEYRAVVDRLLGESTVSWYAETGAFAGHIFVATPIRAEDGVRLGTVIVRFADSLFLERFREARKRVLWAILATVGLLLPLGWLFAKRLTDPLVALGQRMAALPTGQFTAAGQKRRRLETDEISNLAAQFDQMQRELAAGEALKLRIAAADRMAAVGRLAAGIAHEINNPLGGMLNALNTFERFGKTDPVTAKTASLLKRGLGQIKETVGALLVESRLERRSLSAEDLEDIRTLIETDQHNRAISLDWRNSVAGELALPATPVRQLLLNLLLNANAASEAGGEVQCAIATKAGALDLRVANSGKRIPPERIGKLFEPYQSEDAQGNGLGLWVCYQIVEQLKGTIVVESTERKTEFLVELPIGPSVRSEAAQRCVSV